MPKRSFIENLFNAPTDAMREIKKAVSPGNEQGSKAAESARTARSQEIAQAAQADRARSDLLAVQRRREIDAFFSGPSPSERGAMLRTTPDTRPKPISLERERLLQQRESLMQLAQNTKDAARKRDAERRLIEIEDQLRAA